MADITSSAATSKPSTAVSTDDLYKKLNATTQGLSSQEAQQRLQQYGPNALEEKKKSAWAVFGGYFWGPMPWYMPYGLRKISPGAASRSRSCIYCLFSYCIWRSLSRSFRAYGAR